MEVGSLSVFVQLTLNDDDTFKPTPYSQHIQTAFQNTHPDY